jgi:hypothetical protein
MRGGVMFNRTMSDLDGLGTILDEKVFKITCDLGNRKATLWEETLRLHLKPKPDWVPDRLWAKIVNLVVTQSSQRHYDTARKPGQGEG